MLNKIYQKAKKKINSGNIRSIQAKKNIIYSFLIKGANISLGFLLVPMTLNYLNETKYGIWLTIAAFVEWFNFFDIGLDNGFRNKFAEAIAEKDFKQARIYVSTAYAGMIIISIFLLIIFFAVNPFLDWSKIFNTPTNMLYELKILMIFVFCSFSIRFFLRIIGTVLLANQKTALSSILGLIGKILSVLVIFILTKTTNGSLVYFGCSYSLIPVTVLLFFSLFFYTGKYKIYRPGYSYIQFSSLKSMLNLGVKFFIIQIAVLVIFMSDNMIITQLYGPAEVTPYNIAFKYFNAITMIFAIIIAPYWSAYTEAWVQKDFAWIKNIINKLKKIWFLFVIISIVLILFSNFAYKIWIGDAVKIPFILSLVMGIYVVLRAYGGIYVNFLNGIGKVKLQFYTSIITAIINVPLSIFFAKYCNLGVSGVMVGTIICIGFGFIIAPIQYKMIISNKATGIWNK